VHTTQTNLLAAVRDSQNSLAWDTFYRIYSPLLSNFTHRLGLNDADADDVTQEVLLIAQRSLQQHHYDPAKGRFRSWLYGIARRQSLAALRARRRRTRVQSVLPESGADPLQQLADPKGDEAVSAVWREEWRYAMLNEALRHVRCEVSEKSFEAFCLYAIDHHPVQQVANQLGIAPSSVYVYKSRVLEAIRGWVARFEEP